MLIDKQHSGEVNDAFKWSELGVVWRRKWLSVCKCNLQFLLPHAPWPRAPPLVFRVRSPPAWALGPPLAPGARLSPWPALGTPATEHVFTKTTPTFAPCHAHAAPLLHAEQCDKVFNQTCIWSETSISSSVTLTLTSNASFYHPSYLGKKKPKNKHSF